MEEEKKEKKLGYLPYVLGGVSFIPLLGVFFGIIVIIWGIIKIKQKGWRLILIGVCGILFTVILYSTLFYKGFVERGGIYDELKSGMTQTLLTDLVKQIEYYKIQNGKYPKSLKELASKKQHESFTFIQDPTQIDLKTKEPPLFHYELINEGNNYVLFSKGFDRTSNTNDDIHPVISEEEMKNIGYRKSKN